VFLLAAHAAAAGYRAVTTSVVITSAVITSVVLRLFYYCMVMKSVMLLNL